MARKPDPEPTPADLERAWRPQRPQMGPGLAAYQRFQRRSVNVVAGLLLVFWTLMFLSTLANLLGWVDWGYGWPEFWGLLAMGVFGFALFFVVRAWQVFLTGGRE